MARGDDVVAEDLAAARLVVWSPARRDRAGRRQRRETSPMPDPQPVIARQHATTNVLSAQVEQTMGEVREQLTSHRFDYAGDIVVLAGNRLAGLLSIERLLAAEKRTRVADVMNASPPVVTPTADQERVAWEMVKRDG